MDNGGWHNMNNLNKPQFAPKGGIGSTYTDPKTNQKWKFTSKGWEQVSTGNIKQDIEERGTFRDTVNTDDEKFAKGARISGFTDTEIATSLIKKKQLQQEGVNVDAVYNQDGTTVDEGTQITTALNDNPFGGRSKQEVLRFAFQNGVTKLSALEELGNLYDLVVGEEDPSIELPDTFSGLTQEEQLVIKNQVKNLAVSKAQDLGSVGEREGVMDALGTLDTGQEIIDALDSGIKTGFFEGLKKGGVFGVGARTFGLTSKEEDRLAALTNVFTARFIKAISGAQVSDKEREFLMQALPSEWKTKQANIEGIKAIADYLTNRYSPTIGVDLSVLKPTSENSDPLKLMEGGRVTKNNPLGI